MTTPMVSLLCPLTPCHLTLHQSDFFFQENVDPAQTATGTQTDAFDWTAPTEGAKNAYNTIPMVKTVREAAQKLKENVPLGSNTSGADKTGKPGKISKPSKKKKSPQTVAKPLIWKIETRQQFN